MLYCGPGEPTDCRCHWLGPVYYLLRDMRRGLLLRSICNGYVFSSPSFIKTNSHLVETRGRTLEEMTRLFGIESQLVERTGFRPGPPGKGPMDENMDDAGESEHER